MIDALVVIGGSTASGKSGLALAVARAVGGVVLNADSQQLFADLRILTARPTPAEEALARHRLYGVLPADAQPSVGDWLARMAAELDRCREAAAPAIVAGGSGLYLHALLHGMPAMPDIPPDLRRALRDWAAGRPPAELHARLAAVDPLMATRLPPSDPQRLLRALEVIEATGRSLAAWQAMPRGRQRLPELVVGTALLPPAATVNPRIEARLDAMLAEGAQAEVAALLARRPDALRLPIAKVHGLRELAAVQCRALSHGDARAAIAAQIRQYAKRQRTFFGRQLRELAPAATLGDDPALLPMLLARLGHLRSA